MSSNSYITAVWNALLWKGWRATSHNIQKYYTQANLTGAERGRKEGEKGSSWNNDTATRFQDLSLRYSQIRSLPASNILFCFTEWNEKRSYKWEQRCRVCCFLEEELSSVLRFERMGLRVLPRLQILYIRDTVFFSVCQHSTNSNTRK